MSDYDEPNLSVSLASSYNTRGVDGYAALYTSAQDQRKINSMYEVAENAVTGKKTLYLKKRPGAQVIVSALAAASTDIPFLIGGLAGASTSKWVLFRAANGTDMKVASASAVTTIYAAAAASEPAYIDSVYVSGAETVVAQFRRTVAITYRTFYASAIGSWTEITDADFTALTHRGKMEHLDGYAFQMATDNYIYNSDLNSVSSWGATSRVQKQIETDVAAGLAKFGGLILAFGNETVEVFYNAGNPSGSPLARRPELAARIGLAQISGNQTYGGSPTGKRHYSCIAAKKLFFLGSQSSSDDSVGLFAFDGSVFEKVSTPFTNKIFVDTNNPQYHVCTVNVFGEEAVAIALSLPNAATQRWLMFFPRLNEWFEWNSTYFQPVFNGYFIGIGGAASSLQLTAFEYDQGWVDGESTAYTMTHQFMLPKNKGNARQCMAWAGVVSDTAGSTSNVGVSFSDDDYATFSTERNIDLSTTDKRITRCGSYKSRAVRLTHSANLDFRPEQFIARIA